MNHNILSAQKIKAEAKSLGFCACGIAPADRVEQQEIERQQQRIERGLIGDMRYLANHFEMRCDPRLLVEGTQSIICVALNYLPCHTLTKEQYRFAYYAYGKDYHLVMKEKMQQLITRIAACHPLISARAFCDTGPIWERYWASRAGLGWIGRNEQLIIPKAGSYFFLGEILISALFDQYNSPIPSHCGTCTRCVEACPLHAISPKKTLDATKCLSYWTIENKGEIPRYIRKKMGRQIYGCDICQLVCPHNQKAKPSNVKEFSPREDFLSMQRQDWENLTVEQYRTLFKGSAVKRAKYEGLIRNIRAAKENH